MRWLLAALLSAFLLGEWSGWRFLHRPVEAVASQASGLTVRFEDPFRLRLVPRPSLSGGGLTVQAPPQDTGPAADADESLTQRDPLASLGAWSLDLGYGDLLPWPPVFDKAKIIGGTIDVEIDPDAQWSWPWPTDPENMNRTLPIRRLSIPEPLEVRIRHTERDFDLTVALTTPSGPDSNALFAHTTGQWSGLDLDLRAEAPHALSANLGADAQPLNANGSVGGGALAFEGSIAPPWSDPSLRGELEVTAPTLAAVLPRAAGSVPRTAPVSVTTHLDLDWPNVRLRDLHAGIGESRLMAELDIDTGVTPPRLTGSVAASLLRPVDLRAEPRDATSGADGPGNGTLPEFSIERSTFTGMDVALDLHVARLELASDRLDDVRELSANLAVGNGVLSVERLTATLADGTVRAGVRLDSHDASRAPSLDFDLRWQDIDIARWLTGDAAGTFEGRLDGEAKGESSGNTADELLRGLSGRMRARTGDARVSSALVEWIGLDIAEGLGATDETGTPVSCLLVDLPVTKGVAEMNVAVANTPDSLIYATGEIDLAGERLDLRIVSSPKDWSPLDLDAPITVTGSFSDPEIGMAAGQIAEDALASLVLGAVNPLAAILPMMDFGTDAARSGCQAAREAARNLAEGARGG